MTHRSIGYDTAVDRDEAEARLEARVARLEARMDRLAATIDCFDATVTHLDRFGRAMRRWMIVLTVLSMVSTGLTVYLAQQVGSSHGSSPRARLDPEVRLRGLGRGIVCTRCCCPWIRRPLRRCP
jgi:hypothetical protein